MGDEGKCVWKHCVMLWGILQAAFESTCHVANQYKALLTDHIYPKRKYFSPGESGLFHDETSPIHMAQGITDSFDDYANYRNHDLCSH